MQTREFIAKNMDRLGDAEQFPEKHCGSVIFRGGVFYSYGSHYPLLFKLNGVVFINRRGFSVTTAKHIGWASNAARQAGLVPVGVSMDDRNYYGVPTPQSVARSLLIGKLRANDARALHAAKTADMMTWRYGSNEDTNAALRALGFPRYATDDLRKLEVLAREIGYTSAPERVPALA